jgi:metal-responsive CopG/Arc/MetJ family transcriptional regulator
MARIIVEVSDILHTKIKDYAKKDMRSISSVVRIILEKYLNESEALKNVYKENVIEETTNLDNYLGF